MFHVIASHQTSAVSLGSTYSGLKLYENRALFIIQKDLWFDYPLSLYSMIRGWYQSIMTYWAYSPWTFQFTINFIFMPKLRTKMLFLLKLCCNLWLHDIEDAIIKSRFSESNEKWSWFDDMCTSVPLGPRHRYISPKLPPPIRRTILNLSAITVSISSWLYIVILPQNLKLKLIWLRWHGVANLVIFFRRNAVGRVTQLLNPQRIYSISPTMKVRVLI